jgi:hypothetical protein
MDADGNVTKTLTAAEVLSGRKATLADMAKKAATYFDRLQKDCKLLEKGVDVSYSLLCSFQFYYA